MNNYEKKCKTKGLNKDYAKELCQTIVRELNKTDYADYGYIKEKIGKLDRIIDEVYDNGL